MVCLGGSAATALLEEGRVGGTPYCAMRTKRSKEREREKGNAENCAERGWGGDVGRKGGGSGGGGESGREESGTVHKIGEETTQYR